MLFAAQIPPYYHTRTLNHFGATIPWRSMASVYWYTSPQFHPRDIALNRIFHPSWPLNFFFDITLSSVEQRWICLIYTRLYTAGVGLLFVSPWYQSRKFLIVSDWWRARTSNTYRWSAMWLLTPFTIYTFMLWITFRALYSIGRRDWHMSIDTPKGHLPGTCWKCTDATETSFELPLTSSHLLIQMRGRTYIRRLDKKWARHNGFTKL